MDLALQSGIGSFIEETSGDKYGELAVSWTSQPVKHSYGCCNWKAIRAGWNSFTGFVGFSLGDG